MLKLLKYDWKRNSTLFYATLVILFIAQLALFVWNSVKSGWDAIVLGLSIALIVAAMFILFYQVCKTFNHHMSAYNRRLLPVRPIEEIGAVLLLQLIYTVLLFCVAAASLAILLSSMDNFSFSSLKDIGLKPVAVISSLSYSIWSLLHLLAWIMLSIAIAWCFRVKHRVWIGIAAFIIIQSLLYWLMQKIFGLGGEEGNLGFIRLEFSGTEVHRLSDTKVDWFDPLSVSFLSEIVMFIGLLCVTAYLMKKKIEL